MAGTFETLTLTFWQETQKAEIVDDIERTKTTKTITLKVSRDSSTTAKIEENVETPRKNGFVLSKVRWNKTINEPSKLEAEINFATSILEDPNQEYVYSSVKDFISALRHSYLNVALSKTEGENTASTDLALHFVVFSIVRSDQEANVKLTITAYSPDKLLDIDEYCKAYTAKKLVREIVLNQGKMFVKDEDNTAPAMGQNIGQCTRVATGDDTEIYFVEESDEDDEETKKLKMTARLKIDTNLNVLKFTDSEDNEEEFVQPYLVQYNETFYRFLVRTMNRYGEFVYYEDDALHLGLKEIKEKKKSVDEDGNEVETKTAKKFSTSDVDSVEWNTCCMDEDDSTSLEQYAYTSSWPEVESGDNYYHGEVVEDANLAKLKSEKSREESLKKKEKNIWRSLLIGKVTKFPFLLPSIPKIVSYLVSMGVDYLESYLSYENDIKTYKGDYLDPAREEAKMTIDGETLVYPYTSNPKGVSLDKKLKKLLSKKLLNATLCRTVYQNEMIAEKGMITFNVSQQPDLCKLGQVVEYDGDTFVVAGIEYDYVTNEGKIHALPKNDTYSMFLPLPIKERIRKATPQTAVVTDNDDMEGLGRVKIRFLWQEEAAEGESSSPYIRRVQPFASSSGGVSFLPIEGDEVLINFTGGNVEMPYVEGMLYSKTNKAGSPSSETLTIASRNGHKIKFNDPEGNLDFVTSFSPLLSTVETLMTLAGADGKMTIDTEGCGGGITMSDSNGIYKFSMSATDRSISLKSSFGDISLSSLTGVSISAPGGDVTIKAKNISLDASNNITIKSGSKVKKWTWSSASSASSWSKEALSFLKGRLQLVDLSVLRTIIEMFVPPSEGTLLLKSARHLSLEAGKGNTLVGMAEKKSDDKLKKLVNYINAWRNFVNDYDKFVDNQLQSLKNGIHGYTEYREKAEKLIEVSNGKFDRKSLFIDGDDTFLYFCENHTNGCFPSVSHQTNSSAYWQASSSYAKLRVLANEMQKPETGVYSKKYGSSSGDKTCCIPAARLDNAHSNFNLLKKDEFVDETIDLKTQKENIRKAARQAIDKKIDNEDFDFASNDSKSKKEVEYWNELIEKYEGVALEADVNESGFLSTSSAASDVTDFLFDEDLTEGFGIKELISWGKYNSKGNLIRFSDAEDRLSTLDKNGEIKESKILDSISSLKKIFKG